MYTLAYFNLKKFEFDHAIVKDILLPFVEDVVSRLIACDKIQEIKLFLVEEKKNTAVI